MKNRDFVFSLIFAALAACQGATGGTEPSTSSARAEATTASSSQMKSNIEGVWKSRPDSSGISALTKISPCGDVYCGVIVGTEPANSGYHNSFVDTKALADMKTKDGVNFEGGTLTNPIMRATMPATMTLKGDVLNVAGCFLGFCAAQDWTRVQ